MSAAAAGVVVVDVGLGNLRSVERALAQAASDRGLSLGVERSADPDRVAKARYLVVPGQGAFGDGARRLAEHGVDQAVLSAIAAGTPYLGICLGLQLLFSGSEEAPGQPGLGVLPGHVARLDPTGVKIPHMGWNQLEIAEPEHPLLAAAGGAGTFVYFVHSFHAVCDRAEDIAATVTHGNNRVVAAVAHERVFATQFHPEKSQAAGLALLSAFLDMEPAA